TGRVIAFEPDPVNATRLSGNLVLNGLEWIQVEETALWSEPGRMTLHRFDHAFGPWHSLGAPELPHPFHRGATARPVDAVEVGVTSLDAYCGDAGIYRISLLKLDVEGAEPDALRGAAGLLERRAIDVVLFEVSLPQSEALGHQPSDAFDVLHHYSYKTHGIHPDGAVGPPIHESIGRYGNYVALPPGSPHAPLA
ncbi:MAG: FkbM family methyltransferase, partial [Gaiellaceae bacterium]